MQTTKARLTWFQVAPQPIGLYYAECGRYTFEICRTSDEGHTLQMWEIRSEDGPMLVWEKDGFSLDEAKERAERLAGPHVPVMMR